MKKTVVAVITAVMLCMICVGAFASPERPVIKLEAFISARRSRVRMRLQQRAHGIFPQRVRL